jgi:hypothetical protein
MDILRGIEAGALAVRVQAPNGDFMHIADTAPSIELPMERPLHSPALKQALNTGAIAAGDEDLDATALFSQFVVDKAALAQHVRQSLRQRSQITLAELLDARPLQQGLAELVAYLSLAADSGRAAIDDTVQDSVAWVARDGHHKAARLPRVIFSR